MRMRQLAVLALAGTAFIGASLAVTAADASKLSLRYGAEVNERHPVGGAVLWYAERVGELSNGDITIRPALAETLGSAREMVEGMQLGTMDMVTVTAGVVANFAPELDFFSLPFIWDDQDHLQRVVDGPLGDKLKESLANVGIYALGFSTSGLRQLYTGREIRGLEDLRGMKVRTMEVPQIVETWRALGAMPVPVAWGEVYQALQTGVVDGAESSFVGWISQKHYEQAKYGYRINYIDSGRVYMLSMARKDRMSAEQLATLQQATDEMIRERVLEAYRTADEEAAETVKAYGAEVVELDLAPFREAVQPVYERFKPTLGDQVFELIEQARKSGS